MKTLYNYIAANGNKVHQDQLLAAGFYPIHLITRRGNELVKAGLKVGYTDSKLGYFIAIMQSQNK